MNLTSSEKRLKDELEYDVRLPISRKMKGVLAD